MPKYYVESGQFQLVVQAHDAEAAALWSINVLIKRLFDQNGPHTIVVDTESSQSIDPPDVDFASVLRHTDLDSFVLVSEQGFGRSDATAFRSRDVFQKRRQLIRAIQRLIDNA